MKQDRVQLKLRMTPDVHANMTARARVRGTSLNTTINDILKAAESTDERSAAIVKDWAAWFHAHE